MEIKDLKPLIDVVSQYSPSVGAALGLPLTGAAVGSIISLLARLFHANPSDPKDILNRIKADESPEEKIRAIELAIQEIHDRASARHLASQETGAIKYLRPVLIFMANLTLAADLLVMYYLLKDFDIYTLPFILITVVCTWYLIKDIRKMTSFYFGGDN